MNILCPICSELFVQSDEVNITPCGHMFHYSCLLQWLERSKTCPQCRNRCTEQRLVRVYFNVAANLDESENSASLLQKLDNLTLKYREQEKSMNELQAKAAKHKIDQSKMKKTLLGLEEELRAKNTSLFAIKHELDMLQGDRKALVKMKEELGSAQTKLQSYAAVKQALEATAHEVEQMIASDLSRESVITMATALKRELQAQEIKRKEQSDRVKRLQNELIDERRKRKMLEESLSTCDSEIYRLQQLCKRYQKETANDTSIESVLDASSSDDIVPNTPDQRPTADGRKRPMHDLNTSTPVSEKVRKIISSNSPYLRVKTSSVGLAPLMRVGLSAKPSNSASNPPKTEDKSQGTGNASHKYSIFSSHRITASVGGYTAKSRLARCCPGDSENYIAETQVIEAPELERNAPGSRFKLTSSTVTARLKSGKLTRHPSTVKMPTAAEGNAIIDLVDVSDII